MDDATRAEAAKHILGNPTFEMVLDEMKRDVIAKWSAAPARDTEGREWLWQFYQNTLKFEEVLRGYVATGKKLEYDRQQQTMSEKVSDIWRGFRKTISS